MGARARRGLPESRAYFGTDTRAYQLLAGALLAMSPGVLVRIRRLNVSALVSAAGLASLVSLVYLSTWLLDVGPIKRGAAATVATVVVLIALDTAPRGLLARALSLPPLVYLGRISYGTYLWHWPILIVAFEELELSPLGAAAFAGVAATAMASLSYALVEMPIRDLRVLDLRPVGVVVAGVVVSLLAGIVVVPQVFDRAEGTRAAAAGSASVSTGATSPADLNWRQAKRSVADLPDCTVDNIDGCYIVRGGSPRILLIGDSHARMYGPMFEDIGRSLGLEVAEAVEPACPWMRDVTYRTRTEECRAVHDAWYGTIIDAIDPDIVVLSHREIDDDTDKVPIFYVPEDALMEPGHDRYAWAVREGTEATVRWFRERGRQVVLIEPVAQLPKDQDPIDCLAEAEVLEECRFVYQTQPTPQERVFRELDEADAGVWSVDLDGLACPYFPICDPVVDGTIVRRDTTHLTVEFVRLIAPAVEATLLDLGVFQP